MKKLITLLAVIAFSMLMLAQDSSQPNQSQSNSSQSQSSQATPSQNSQSSQDASANSSSGTNSGQRMSGKVGNKGKSFTDDAGKGHKVNNPDALQNYQNQHVVVLVQADPDTGNLTITAVQPPQ
jgi:hypothetical protein